MTLQERLSKATSEEDVKDALNKGEYVPPFLAVIDTKKASLMKTSDVIPFLAKKTIKWGKSASQYPKEALDEGRELWKAYFVHTDVRVVRNELKLNRADVGWYQIRKALQHRNASDDFVPVSFKPFELAYKALSEKLHPQVYDLGFLRA